MIKLQKFDILYDSTVRTSPEFLKKCIIYWYKRFQDPCDPVRKVDPTKLFR